MKIVGIVAHLCHFPLPKPFYPSWTPGYPQGRNSAFILTDSDPGRGPRDNRVGAEVGHPFSEEGAVQWEAS